MFTCPTIETWNIDVLQDKGFYEFNRLLTTMNTGSNIADYMQHTQSHIGDCG